MASAAVALVVGRARAGLLGYRQNEPGHYGHGRLPPGGQPDLEVDRHRERVSLLVLSQASRGSAATHANGTLALAASEHRAPNAGSVAKSVASGTYARSRRAVSWH
jgi:hypothetical protein